MHHMCVCVCVCVCVSNELNTLQKHFCIGIGHLFPIFGHVCHNVTLGCIHDIATMGYDLYIATLLFSHYGINISTSHCDDEAKFVTLR